MIVEWNIPLVILSVLIAIIGSHTALTQAQRMRISTGHASLIWMVVGSITLGSTIWSMHFIGMLALHLQIPIGYDLALTLVSMVPAIISALLAFSVLRQVAITTQRIIESALLMGAGISIMHYTGMAAIQMSPPFSYNYLSVIASILVAFLASLGAIMMMYRGETVRIPPVLRFLLGGTIMGLAISGMHYTSLIGLQFMPDSICLSYETGIGHNVPAVMVSAISLFWFGAGMIAALSDQRNARRNAEALSRIEYAHSELQARTSELQEQETLLRSITDSAQDAVILIDADGRVTYWNPAAEKMFGYAVSEIMGQNLHDLVTPERYLGSYRQGFSRFVQSGSGPLIGTTRRIMAKRRNGEEFPVEISLSAVKSHGSWSAVGIVRDVTERERAEEQIRSKSEHLEVAQRLAHIGSWDLDLATGKLGWSDEIFRLFEIDMDQFSPTYDAFLQAIHPDDRDAVNIAFTNSLATRQPYEIIHRLRMSDGRIKWVHERGQSEYDATGKPISSAGTVQDISERKKYEAELKSFKAIIESSDDAIISKSLQGIVASWNKGAEHVFGYTAEEIVGNPMLKLFPQDRIDEEAEILGRIARGEKVDHLETVRRHKDGHLIDISTTISPILDETGKVIGASNIARDIVERKAMEKQIRQLAFYDPLTSLPNRRLFLDRCKQALRVSARGKSHGAIMFLDLDRFKLLNDTQGHDVGDMLLIEVGKRLVASVREVDTVARMGGDEFVVLLEELSSDQPTAREQASAMAEKIRASLNADYLLGEYTHKSSPSIGVCVFMGDKKESVDELIAKADKAMYQAKTGGRNRVCIYQE